MFYLLIKQEVNVPRKERDHSAIYNIGTLHKVLLHSLGTVFAVNRKSCCKDLYSLGSLSGLLFCKRTGNIISAVGTLFT